MPATASPRTNLAAPSIEPKKTLSLKTKLILVGAVVVLLLGAGVVFWRQSLRAEELEGQIARDRQLKSLGEVSAVLGHEIRNPLASLKGHAQLLVERLGEDHPGHKGAARVVHEAERLEAASIICLHARR